jgi:protein-disulfide isomerase
MEKAAPFMMLAIVVMAFMLGLMWNKLQTPVGPAKFTDKINAYAKELKLDVNKFKKCVVAGKKAVVDADTASGAQAGVTGTPAFFVNGRLIAGAYPFSEFKKIIDEELAGGQNKPTETRAKVEVGSASVKGQAGSPITLIEYSDFQCPFCVRAEPTIKQILSEYGDKVLFVYKHFPLTQIHPLAQRAAEASECAKDQGKFWEFHGKLFDTQTEWSNLQ